MNGGWLPEFCRGFNDLIKWVRNHSLQQA
jgi:hypothetical protein